MNESEKLAFADEIQDFLEKHGGIKGDYDPTWDSPEERFNSPDASELDYFSKRLKHGLELKYPWASWVHGGFKERGNKDAEQWFKSIMERASKLLEDEKVSGNH